MWVKHLWPFSILYRIERKVDHMSSRAEQIKLALDALGGHLAGIKSGVDSIIANMQAVKAQHDADGRDSALLDAALSEANDLAKKFGGLEEALAANGSSVPAQPQFDPPPPAEEQAPAPAPAPAPAAMLDPNGNPPADSNPAPVPADPPADPNDPTT
jgi:hypothetical protein